MKGLKRKQLKAETRGKEQALRILEGLSCGAKVENSGEFEAWLASLEGEAVLSPLEHTTLLALAKNSQKQDPIDQARWDRYSTLLRASYEVYAGRKPRGLAHLKRLPKRVLASWSKEEVLFHQAVFARETKDIWGSLAALWENYVPKMQDFVILTAVFALAYFVPFLVAGLALGYAFSSVVEFLFHLYVGHSTPTQKKILDKLGRIGKNFAVFHIEHSVHHGSVHKNYVGQFAPSDTSRPDYAEQTEKNRQAVHASILKRGGEKLLHSVVSSNYGTGSSNEPKTYAFFSAIALIFLSLVWAGATVAGLNLGVEFYVGFMALSQLWIPASTVYHPLLHLPRQKAEEQSGLIMKLFLKTRVCGFIARSHRVHHDKGGVINQNLNPGADFFYGWHQINTKQLFDLVNRKAIY